MPSDSSSNVVMLTAYTVAAWKRYILGQALKLNALGILDGSEKKPSSTSDAKVIASFAERRSKMAGAIFETLDEAQSDVLLNDIATLNVARTYTTLLETYEPKTSGSRVSALQELLALRKGAPGHENESYQDFGARAVALGNRFASLLPKGATYTAEVVIDQVLPTFGSGAVIAQGVTNTVPIVAVEDIERRVTPSAFDAGFTAKDVVNDLASAMIILGLGPDDDQLCHTINHLADSSDSKVVLEHLGQSGLP
jgi:hypothetical protein